MVWFNFWAESMISQSRLPRTLSSRGLKFPRKETWKPVQINHSHFQSLQQAKKNNTILKMFKQNSMYFSLCPPSCPFTVYQEKTDFVFVSPLHQIFIFINSVKPSLLQLSQLLLVIHMLYFFSRLTCRICFSVSMSLVLGIPVLNTALHMWSHQSRVEGRITSFDPLSLLFLIQLRITLTFFATVALCWLVFSLSTRTPRSSSTKPFFSQYWFILFALGFVELYDALLGPFLHPVQITLTGRMAL